MVHQVAAGAASSGFLNPEQLISAFGLAGIVIMVFAESGLLVGFFLPGDSLLFTAGLLVASDRYLHYPLWLVIAAICVAAIAGDQVGYGFGRRSARRCSASRTRGCSSSATWCRRGGSSTGTARGLSCWPGSFHWYAHSRRSSQERPACVTGRS